MRQENTISIHFAHAILVSVQKDKAVIAEALRLAGISQQIFKEPRSRITANQLNLLLKFISKRLNDELLGLSLRPMPLGSFSLLARNALLCENILSVYRNTRYALVAMTNQFSIEIIDTKEQVKVRFHTQPSCAETSRTLIELILLIWHRFPSWLVGKDLSLIEVNLPFSAPPYAQEYGLLFSANINFNCEAAELVMSHSVLNQPCKRTFEELTQYIVELPEAWFQRMAFNVNEVSLKNACLNFFAESNMQNITALANRLNKSERTLRRELANERTSFSQLKNQYLRDSAIHLLNDKRNSVEQVGNTLGYTETSAFSRAFKIWTGSSPRQYRQNNSPLE
jgi:AraC-like DNA-binding protein